MPAAERAVKNRSQPSKQPTDAIPKGFCPFSVQPAGKTDAENPQVNR
jgi:hypothetical protein